MKKHLIATSTTDMAHVDWLKFRKRGIGASEVSAIMGLNPYKSSIELFYDKLGEEVRPTMENMAMFMGHRHEPLIAEMWQYWDGTEESMMKNFNEGKKVRKCARVNAYIQNPKYPHLFVSLDRRIIRGDEHEEGVLELKTISNYERDKWELDIPPGYAAQVQTQIIVTELTWGELALMTDGRKFDCFKFDRHEGLCNNIISLTKEFWDRVEKGRQLITRRTHATINYNQKEVNECDAQLQLLEPPPDGSDAYDAFLKEKYKIAEPGERQGTPQQLEWAEKREATVAQIKELEPQKQLYEQLLKNEMRDGCDVLNFGPKGKVSWKANKNGVRSMRFDLKP